jgi:SagB-type dehydrogenase family enzyme
MKPLVLAVSIGFVLLASCRGVGQDRPLGLPEPALEGLSLEEAIAARRSVRSYSEDSLSMKELSQILFAAQGITATRGNYALRAAPSAGGTYPIEVYAFAERIEGLAPGIYHYLPEGHAIELVKAGPHGKSLAEVCLGQSMPGEAALSVVLAAVPERTTSRYGERGIRYVHMEAGHVSQNICLECASLGLGAVPIGAFDDRELDRLIGIDGESEISLYVNSIGRIREKRGDSK